MSLTAEDVNYIVYRYLQEAGAPSPPPVLGTMCACVLADLRARALAPGRSPQPPTSNRTLQRAAPAAAVRQGHTHNGCRRAGLVHTAYALRHEVDIGRMDIDHESIAPGSLVRLLQRGLQYLELEANVSAGNDGADAKFAVLTAIDILQAQDADKLKALLRERQDDATSSKGRPRCKAKPCAECGLVLNEGLPVFTARWNPSGDMLACYSQRPDATIWHVGSSYASTGGRGKPEQVVLHVAGSEGSVSTAALWRPDGRQVATGKETGSIHLWHPDGAAMTCLHRHAARIVPLLPRACSSQPRSLQGSYTSSWTAMRTRSSRWHIPPTAPSSSRRLATRLSLSGTHTLASNWRA